MDSTYIYIPSHIIWIPHIWSRWTWKKLYIYEIIIEEWERGKIVPQKWLSIFARLGRTNVSFSSNKNWEGIVKTKLYYSPNKTKSNKRMMSAKQKSKKDDVCWLERNIKPRFNTIAVKRFKTTHYRNPHCVSRRRDAPLLCLRFVEYIYIFFSAN